MCLDGDKVSGSASEFAVVVSIAAGTVVRVAVVVSAVVVVVVVFWVINGLFSLLSICSLSLAPNSRFHGIRPRITLEAVVVVVAVVETDGSLFVAKTGSIVGSNSGASAEVMYPLEASGLDSVWVI